MSGNRGPRRSSLAPTSGLSPSRLMWSLSSTRSPGPQSGFMPPQALDTTSVRAPERVHHADREGDLLEVVALVAVEPPLHRHDRPAAQPAEQQPAGVGLDGGQRKARDVAVRDLGLHRDLLGEPAEPGAEDDADLRHERACARAPRRPRPAPDRTAPSPSSCRAPRTAPCPAGSSSRLPRPPPGSRRTCPSRARAAGGPARSAASRSSRSRRNARRCSARVVRQRAHRHEPAHLEAGAGRRCASSSAGSPSGSTPPFCGSSLQLTWTSTACRSPPADAPVELGGQVEPVDRMDQGEAAHRLPRLVPLQRADQMPVDPDAGERVLLLQRLLHPVLAHVRQPGRRPRPAPPRGRGSW